MIKLNREKFYYIKNLEVIKIWILIKILIQDSQLTIIIKCTPVYITVSYL